MCILEYADKFTWFGHMWDHRQPHTVSSTEVLIDLMKKNLEFATKNNIKTDTGTEELIRY